MKLSKSDIVLSLSGRDKGKYFFVVDTAGEYVMIADGRYRKLEQPKRKKLKHLQLVRSGGSGVAAKICSGDKVLNSELRRDLATFGQQFNSQNQGG